MKKGDFNLRLPAHDSSRKNLMCNSLQDDREWHGITPQRK